MRTEFGAAQLRCPVLKKSGHGFMKADFFDRICKGNSRNGYCYKTADEDSREGHIGHSVISLRSARRISIVKEQAR